MADDKPSEDFIDWNTFQQILEMDDDENDREFSAGIVANYFEQAESTFEEMDNALATKDLKQLSSLGHFLKGSSAALGLTKIQNSCEKIQHLGNNLDETGNFSQEDSVCLDRIKAALSDARTDYANAQNYMQSFFGEALTVAKAGDD
uniref:ARAD1D14080p n=1 Tax=Blastobotrys adeninivorans TaxID=409370 RepID=A0A060TFA7_BLAAD